MTQHLYSRRLSDADLAVLTSLAGVGRADAGRLARLRETPAGIEDLLRQGSVFEALFGSPDPDPCLLASPFLAFAVLVERAAADLEMAAFVQEWLGPGRTVPLFDVGELREFAAGSGRRAFLADVLASFTRVASGSVWERTARGWRRRRYSELDPLGLAELLTVVPPGQRRAVTRRLGDLALFLSGVFPDYAAAHPLAPRHLERIARLLGTEAPGELALSSGAQRGIWLLEWLGRRSYEVAARATSEGPDLVEVSRHFGRARRILNHLTGRYLYPQRGHWFPPAFA